MTKQLVGVHSHVQGIMAKLEVHYRNGRAVKIGDTCSKVLLIHGIPGVGKTALALYVYNQLYHLFDACSFLGEVQAVIEHHGVLSAQNKLISDLRGGDDAQKFDRSFDARTHMQYRFPTMKVLLLLDDVKDHEQLTVLIGKLDWLGPGSRVILTSQTQDVLRNLNGAESFALGLMKQDDALRLFYRHAFGKDAPSKKFEKLSADIVAATGRLPLALVVIGSSLFPAKSKKALRETLTALEAAPGGVVQVALEKSYANLNDKERQIFLDIACFFIGMDKRIPSYMWDKCKYSPSKSIQVLQNRSLVDIGEDKELRMHETVKNFAREIVKNENRNEPCERSRLWDHQEALDMLETTKGIKKVEAFGLKFGDGSERNISFKCDQFNGFENLRYLKLDRADIRGKFGDRLSSLRWLDWRGCPKNFDVQSLNLNLQNLLILNLSGSQVDQGWRGWALLKQTTKLKVLNLTGCVQLTVTPIFPDPMELQVLILEDCSNLALIHLSFGNLKKLVCLNMKGCRRLSELPDLGPMIDLQELVIDGTSIHWIDFAEGSVRKLQSLSARGCKYLNEIPDSIRYLKSLTYLALDGTEIRTLPEFIGLLKKLQTLSLKNCGRLSLLPDGIGKLSSIKLLDLSHTGIQNLPDSLRDLKARNVVRMRDTFIDESSEA